MANKLVGVRFPEPLYRKLQRHKRRLGLRGDAEAIRAIVEAFSPVVTVDEIPIFNPRITSRVRPRRGRGLANIDEVVYGDRWRKRTKRRRRR